MLSLHVKKERLTFGHLRTYGNVAMSKLFFFFLIDSFIIVDRQGADCVTQALHTCLGAYAGVSVSQLTKQTVTWVLTREWALARDTMVISLILANFDRLLLGQTLLKG